MDYIEITMRNFSALVKRNDIKTPQWFAMPNDLLEHPDFFDISGDQLKAYVWICGVASKLNTATIKVYPDLCARRIAIQPSDVIVTIEKLNKKRWDVTSALRTSVRVSYATEQNRTEQDRTEQGIVAKATSTVVEKSTPMPAESIGTDLFVFGGEEEILGGVPQKNLARWLSVYDNDEEFVRRELIRAVGWYFDNPRKKPKSKRGWLAALNSWLERAWGFRSKNIRGNTQQPKIENLVKSTENLAWANAGKDKA